jgi:hypothetical protein
VKITENVCPSNKRHKTFGANINGAMTDTLINE